MNAIWNYRKWGFFLKHRSFHVHVMNSCSFNSNAYLKLCININLHLLHTSFPTATFPVPVCICMWFGCFLHGGGGGWVRCSSFRGFQCHNHCFLFQEVYPNLCFILFNRNEEPGLDFRSSLFWMQWVMWQIIKNTSLQQVWRFIDGTITSYTSMVLSTSKLLRMAKGSFHLIFRVSLTAWKFNIRTNILMSLRHRSVWSCSQMTAAISKSFPLLDDNRAFSSNMKMKLGLFVFSLSSVGRCTHRKVKMPIKKAICSSETIANILWKSRSTMESSGSVFWSESWSGHRLRYTSQSKQNVQSFPGVFVLVLKRIHL